MIERGLESRQTDAFLGRLRAALAPIPDAERTAVVDEISGHISDRVAQGGVTEAAVLAGFGDPETLARGFVEDHELSSALNRSMPGPLLANILARSGRSVIALAASFLGGVLYLVSVSFALIAILKPILPNNVGLWVSPRQFQFGVMSAPLPDERLGLWIVPIAVIAAIAAYVAGTTILKRYGRWRLSRSQSAIRA